MGPIGLMFTAVSGIMGSAWLFGPYYAAKMAGPASLFAWVIGAMIMIIIAMTFAELVCMLPISGGNARFLHFTHGTLASFIFSWVLYIGYAAVAPVETMGVLQYLASVYPSLVTKVNAVTVLTLSGYVAAAGVLLLMCIVNMLSIKWLARYNSVIVWFKVLVPITVAVVLITMSFHISNFTHLPGGFMPTGFNGLAQSLSMGGIVFAFAGYAPVIVLAGEAKNPQKVIPLVLVGALGLCLMIYFVLQVALIGSLSPADVSHGWSHLSFTGDASPFVGLADRFHLGHLKLLIFLTAVIAPLGTAIIFIATSSRVAYAISQNGCLPAQVQFLSKRGVPIFAVIMNFIVGMVLFFPSPGWQGMVGFLVSAFVMCYAIGPIALLTFRKNLKDRERPFRLPCAPLWCFVAFYVSNLLIYWTGWVTVWHMLVAILIGLVLFAVSRIIKRKADLNLVHGWWVLFYFVGMGVISYSGDFGGGLNLFAYHIDLLVMGLFSLLILVLAYQSRLSEEETLDYCKV